MTTFVTTSDLHKELEKQWNLYLSGILDVREHPIHRLIQSKTMMEIGEVSYDHHEIWIPRCGDLLIGVVSDKEVEIEVFTGQFSLSRQSLHANEPRLLLDNVNILPMISLQYQSINMKKHPSDAKIRFIWGYLDFDYRRFACHKEWSLNIGSKSFSIRQGGLHVCVWKNIEQDDFPPIKTSWRYIAEKKRLWLSLLEEELIQRTWHPSRFMRWCLSEVD